MAGLIELDLDPDEKTLRQFGWIALVAFTGLSWAAHTERLIFSVGLGSARPVVVAVLLVLALASGAFSLIHPRANRPIYVGLSLLTYPIGRVVSLLAFGLLYFGILTPIGGVFRIIKRDELGLRNRGDCTSYWRDADPRPDRDRYFRQF